MISAINEIETAVQAMKHGAYHYITKDFDYDQLRSLVRNASERQDLNRQVLTLSAQVADETEREFIVGPSKNIRDIVDLVNKIARLSATVLVLGERHRQGTAGSADPPGSGTGNAPFVAVNLAAIPRELVESTLFGHERGSFTGAHRQQLGKFELAANGTLSSMKSAISGSSSRPFRAIQEGKSSGRRRQADQDRVPPDRRHQHRSGEGGEGGRFREDLFYRINVIPIKMPLRERAEDVPLLAEFF
jgi:DNA-binding NtrC family response regulator